MDSAALSNRDSGAGPDAPLPDTKSETDTQPPVVLTGRELVEKVRAYHPSVKSELLLDAYEFAKQHHGEQLRASGDAYYSHPVQVASLLADVELDEITIVAGLLHDVVEDVDEISIGDIEVRFGPDVAELVDGVTKLDKLTFDSQEIAQAENFQKFILASCDDLRVLLVKLADRLHNMRTIKHLKKEEKRQRIARETMEIYAPLARRIGAYQVAAQLEDLSFEQINPDARRAIQYRLDELSAENADDLERIRSDLRMLMDLNGIECRIKGRRKQPYSVWRKLEKKSISFRDVADIFAFRVIVKQDVADCYRVLGEVHTLWACLPDRFRDFISVPKPNGYASLHTTVRASGNRRVELQIRTEDMDQTAELGVAAHWGYKNSEYGFDPDSARAMGLDPISNLQAFSELLDGDTEVTDFYEHAKLEMYRDYVFAFTPKGKLLKLPQGAMPLDFAYAVHSMVGDTCVGVRINGEQKPLRTELKNGDVVEILRGPTPRPIAGSEALSVTGKARASARRLVNTVEAKEFQRLGEGLINQALRLVGLDPVDVKMSNTAKRAGFKNRSEMTEAVGRGKMRSADVVAAAFPGYELDQIDQTGKTKLDSAHAPLFVAGEELTPGVSLHLGTCCHPLPGDRIIGVQEPERGLVVHVASCSRLAEFDETPELWVDLKWTELALTGAVAVGRLRINAANERGVLAKLCTAVAQANGNITRISTDHRHPDFIELVMDIEVEDLKRLTQILAALRSLAVVDKVIRDQEGIGRA